eukprot:97186-Heterocapsa_arctica.AAC.1
MAGAAGIGRAFGGVGGIALTSTGAVESACIGTGMGPAGSGLNATAGAAGGSRFIGSVRPTFSGRLYQSWFPHEDWRDCIKGVALLQGAVPGRWLSLGYQEGCRERVLGALLP